MLIHTKRLACMVERMLPISKAYECGCIDIDSDEWSLLNNGYKAELCADCLFACAKSVIHD